MSDEQGIPYYVVYVGLIAGEYRYGSQKVLSPVPFDTEEIIHEVAKNIKAQKHYMEVTVINWKELKS